MIPIYQLPYEEAEELLDAYLTGPAEDEPTLAQAMEWVRQRINKTLEDSLPDAISQPVRDHLAVTLDMATRALVMHRFCVGEA